jgi:hypothetical protein
MPNVSSNTAMDDDTFSALLRAPISAHYCERYASRKTRAAP